MTTLFIHIFLLLGILFLLSANLSYFCTNESYSTISLARRFGIRKFNRDSEKTAELIPPFIPFRSTFVTSPKYSLAACRIQKNLSTILLNLFCFLNTPRKFSRKAASLTTEFRNSLSLGTCNGTHASHIATDTTFETKLVVIRDPVQRFLSAFVDKCLHEAKEKQERCYGCRGDLMCVLEFQYKRFQMIAIGNLTQFTYEDRHFAPMSWFCDFDADTVQNYRFLYFGETHNEQKETIDELMEILDEHGVDNSTITHIHQELSETRTKHSTSGSAIRERVERDILERKDVMRMLYLLYKNDYNIFKLKSPFEDMNSS